jgi:ATP-dependent Clp protease ATP-binding subunit ClpB
VPNLLCDQVRNYLPPELINRLDELIVFNSLTPETMRGVVDARVRELKDLLQDRHNLDLELEPDAVEWLATEGFDLAYGARPLRRLVQRAILNPLAAELLEGTVVPEGGTVRISVSDGDGSSLRISQD